MSNFALCGAVFDAVLHDTNERFQPPKSNARRVERGTSFGSVGGGVVVFFKRGSRHKPRPQLAKEHRPACAPETTARLGSCGADGGRASE